MDDEVKRNLRTALTKYLKFLLILLLLLLLLCVENEGNRYKHRLSLLKGGRTQELKGLEMDKKVLRLVRAACWAIQVCVRERERKAANGSVWGREEKRRDAGHAASRPRGMNDTRTMTPASVEVRNASSNFVGVACSPAASFDHTFSCYRMHPPFTPALFVPTPRTLHHRAVNNRATAATAA